VGESADQIVCSVLNSFFVILDSMNNFVQSNQTLYSLVEITAVLEVADVFHHVIDLTLSGWIKLFFLGAFHFFDLLAQVFIIIHEMHLIVGLRRVEVQGFSSSGILLMNILLDGHIFSVRPRWHGVSQVWLLGRGGCLWPLSVKSFHTISISERSSQIIL